MNMKPIFATALALLCVGLAVKVHAGRINGVLTDMWCQGDPGGNYETCLDNIAQWYPTVNNAQTFGKSSYRWSTIYGVNANFSGTITGTIAASQVNTAAIQADAVGTTAILNASVNTAKILTNTNDSGKILASCGGVAMWRVGGTCP